MKAILIPLRFGLSARRELTPESAGALLRAMRLLVGQQITLNHCPILWISEEYKLHRSSTSTLIVGAMAHVSTCEVIVIDCGGPRFAGAIDPAFSLGVSDAVEIFRGLHPKATIVVLCPGSKHPLDADYERLQAVCTTQQASFIYSAGGSFGALWENAVAREAGIAEQINNIYESVNANHRGRIVEKSIRHVGRFQFAENGPIHPFFYDFKNCHSEAVDACVQYLDRVTAELGSGNFRIAYDCAVCDWFEAAVQEAIGQVGLAEHSERFTSSPSVALGDRQLVVLFPIFRTGSRVQEVLRHLGATRPKVWCFVGIEPTTRANPAVEEHGPVFRSIAIQSGDTQRSIEVECFLGVQDYSRSLERVWKEIDAPTDPIPTGSSGALFSSWAMWGMIIESGFAKETYGPLKHRTLLPAIPNFALLIERNSNLLADKIRHICSEIIGTPLPESLIYLCVDEPCARQISQRITGSDYDRTLFMSRELIDLLCSKQNAGELDEIEISEALQNEKVKVIEAIRGLRSIARTRPLRVVAFDEFVYGGNTLGLLKRACDLLNLNLEAHISIASLTGNRVKRNFVVQSLYEFGYADSTPSPLNM